MEKLRGLRALVSLIAMATPAFRSALLPRLSLAIAGAVLASIDADRATSDAPERRRVLVHSSGFRQSPYADVRPAGGELGRMPAAKLWHTSPGSSSGR